MAYRTVDEDNLKAIANVIRAATDTADTLTFPEDFISGIYQSQPLNFNVVDGTSAPASPKENTIWVNTSTAITGWYIGNVFQGNLANGAVWIQIDTDSPVFFNALRKNSFMIYPISPKQYIDGAWVDKETKIYQNSKWVDLWNNYLYTTGNEWSSITGGWIAQGLKFSSDTAATAPSLTKNSTYLRATLGKSGSSGNGGVVRPTNAIDLTKYSTVSFDIEYSRGVVYNNIVLIVYKPSVTYLDYSYRNATVYYAPSSTSASRTTYNLNVSTLSGEYMVGVYLYNGADSNSLSVNIYNVRLS